MTDAFHIKNGVLMRYKGKGSSSRILKNLHSVEIPEGVTAVGKYAFFSCNGVGSIVLPDSVKKIDSCAFYNCKQLESVFIPESVVMLGDNVFFNCENLTHIRIPDSVVTIGAPVFSKPVNLEDYPDGCIVMNQKLIQYVGRAKTVVIPEHVRKIQTYAFYQSPAETIVIPETAEPPQEDAFFLCKQLRCLVIHQIRMTLEENSLSDLRRKVHMADCILNFLNGKEIKKNKDFLIRNKKMLFCTDSGTFRKILETGQIFRQASLDELILHAIEVQDYEKQLLLLNYKYQHCGFEDRGEKLKL